MAELLGTPISEGTVAAVTTRAAGGLDGFLERVRANLAAAEVVNFDETGLRVQGRLRWVHSASTRRYSLIFVHDRRGTKGMDAAGVLPEFTGIAVHDVWAPYDSYKSVTHALCGAHDLRELQAVTDLADEDQWCWATQAGDALRELNHLVNDALAASSTLDIDPAALADAVDRYRSAALLGVEATRPPTSKLMGKHNALARRLIDRQDDYLRFTLDPRVPFELCRRERNPDDQAAAEGLRMPADPHRRPTVLRHPQLPRNTAAKHGIHFFAALTTLAEGRPWLPEIA